jgi:uncharacterized repeat protein (TIGR01451 family)
MSSSRWSVAGSGNRSSRAKDKGLPSTAGHARSALAALLLIGSAGVASSVGAASSLSLQKFSDHDSVMTGAAHRYSFYVVNSSTDPDDGVVTVTDTFPAGTVGVYAWGAGWNCQTAVQGMTCMRQNGAGIPPAVPPSLGVASPITVEVLARTQTGVVVNQAQVDSQADSTPNDNTASASVAVGNTGSPFADLALENASTGNPTVPEGFAYSYVLTASNESLVDETGLVTINAVLPDPSMTLVDVVGDSGFICTWQGLEFGVPERLVTCTRQGLADGVEATVTIKVLAGQPGTSKVRAWVSGTGDPDTSNNISDKSIWVIASTAPNLSIASTSDPAFPVPVGRGSPITYTLNVGNLGPGMSVGTITVTDVLPDSVSYVGASGNGWACNESSGTVTCSRATPIQFNAPPITVSAVAPNTPGTLINRAFVTSSEGDLEPNNNATETVTAIENAAPVADGEAYVTPEGQLLTVSAGEGVLSNDLDGDTDPLTAVRDAVPARGQLTFNADGSFVYEPDPLYNGMDSFTYHATDGVLNSAVMTVTIAVGNVPPTIADQQFTVAEDEFVGTMFGPVAADDDGNIQLLTFAITGGDTGAFAVDETTGDITIMTPLDYETQSSYALDVQVFDGESAATATITISVTDVINGPGVEDLAPIAVSDAIQVPPGGTATTLIGGATTLLANDIVLDGDAIHAQSVSIPAHGSLSLNTHGVFSYANDIGDPATTDSFQYEACDPAGNCTTATVSITISHDPMDQLPSAEDDAMTVTSGGTASILADGSASVLTNDQDPDGDVLKAGVLMTTAHGTLSLAANGTFSYANNGNDPAASDSFYYQACDPQGACAAAEVTITITPVGGGNTPPVIAPGQTFSVPEDHAPGSVVESVEATDDGLPDPPGAMTFSITAGNAGNAFAIGVSSGEITVASALDYETRSGYVLTVMASDGELTTEQPVTIAITDVVGGPGVENAAPIVVDDAIQVASGGSATVLIGGADSVLANDSDPDGNALHATVTAQPGAGTLQFNADGTFSYTNTTPGETSDSFEYEACDIHEVCTGGIVTISITDGPMNQLPIALGDAIEVAPGGAANVLVGGANSVLANDSDPDGDSLTATAVSETHHGTLTLDAAGTFVYANDASDPSPDDSFLYQACDTHGACVAAEVTITVSQALPVINCILPTQVHEVGDAVSLDLSFLFTAPQGQGLSYGTDGLPLSVSVNATTGLLTGTFATNDDDGSPYLASLMAMTVPGGASASEDVSFVVLPDHEIVLRNGFDGNTVGQPCQ